MSSPLYTLPLSAHKVAVGLAKVAKEAFPDTNFDFRVESGAPNFDVSFQASGQNIETSDHFKKFLQATAARLFVPCSSAWLKSMPPIQNAIQIFYKTDLEKTCFEIVSSNSLESSVAVLDALH